LAVPLEGADAARQLGSTISAACLIRRDPLSSLRTVRALRRAR
jgi:hypothetical protein